MARLTVIDSRAWARIHTEWPARMELLRSDGAGSSCFLIQNNALAAKASYWTLAGHNRHCVSRRTPLASHFILSGS